MAIKLSELADETGCRLHGDDCLITNVSDLDTAKEGDIAFVYNPKYLDKITSTDASAIILKEIWLKHCPKPALVADNPRLAFVKAARYLNPEKRYEAGISGSADVADDVSVPESAYIGPNVVIEPGVKLGDNVQIGANIVICSDSSIGDNTVIHPNVSIGHGTEIGDNCIIYAGTVIGADGFGYERDGDHYLKVPQLGNVRIGNNVEIGANAAIDRGALLILLLVMASNSITWYRSHITWSSVSILSCRDIPVLQGLQKWGSIVLSAVVSASVTTSK